MWDISRSLLSTPLMGTHSWRAIVATVCGLPLVIGTVIADPNGKAVLPDAVCIQISKAVSSASGVFHPGNYKRNSPSTKAGTILTGDPLYDKGIFHYAISSSQNATCVVEPGTPVDVGKIVSEFPS